MSQENPRLLEILSGSLDSYLNKFNELLRRIQTASESDLDKIEPDLQKLTDNFRNFQTSYASATDASSPINSTPELKSKTDQVETVIQQITEAIKAKKLAPSQTAPQEATKSPNLEVVPDGIERELSDYETASAVAGFDFTADYNGQSIDDFIYGLRFKINATKNHISTSGVSLDDQLKLDRRVTQLTSRVDAIERKVATELIEIWKRNLDTADLDFGQLKRAIAAAQAFIFASGGGVPATDPNVHIVQIKTTRKPVENKINSHDTLGKPNYSGVTLQYLKDEYLDSADAVLRELNELNDRWKDNQDTLTWRTRVNRLATAVNLVIDNTKRTKIATATYNVAVNFLADIQNEKILAESFLRDDLNDGPILNNAKRDLVERTQVAENVAQERIDDAGLEELNLRPEIVALKASFVIIRAINKSTQIAPHNPGGLTTANLEAMESDLEIRYTAAKSYIEVASVFFNKSTKAVNEKNALIDNYREIKTKIAECLTESKKEKNLSNPEKIAQLRQKLEDAYGNLTSLDKPSKGEKSSSLTEEHRQNIKRYATDLDSLMGTGDSNQKEWEIKLNLWDGFIVGANTDVLSVQVAWRSSANSRKSAMGEISFASMRDFMNMPGAEDAIDELEDIFRSLPYVYQTAAGTPLIDPSIDPTLPIEQRVVGVKRNRSGQPVDATGNPTNDINQMVKLSHNYAKNGQPQDLEKTQGKLTTMQLVKILHPTLPDSTISAAHFMAVIGELRAKAFIPYYAHYSESPKGTFDMEPIIQASPEAFLLYKVRSIGAIYDKFRNFFKIWSLPRGGGTLLSSKTMETESLPSVATDEISGMSHMPVKGTENVRRALHVRDVLNAYTSAADLGTVELGNDLQWIPTIWDVIRNGKNSGTTFNYDNTTYAQYVDGITALEKFNHLMNFPPALNSSKDLATNLGIIVSTFSPVKEIHNIITPGSDYYRIWNQTIRQLILRYVKDQHDKFMLVSGLPSDSLKSTEFLRQLREAFDKQASLPADIRDDIIDFVSLGVEGVTKATIGKIRSLFSPTIHRSLNPDVWGNRQLKPVDARRLFSMTQGDVAAHTRFGTVALPLGVSTGLSKIADDDVKQFTRELDPVDKKQSQSADSKEV